MAEQVSTRPLLDKLGVRDDAKVAVVGLDDPVFDELLKSRTGHVIRGRRGKGFDLIFFAADDVRALDQLVALEPLIVRNGAIWVVSIKGRAARVRDVAVIDAAKRAGLVDNKVVAFSETRTALRLVVPKARR